MSRHDAGFEAALADRYQVKRELGQGTSASVYLAQDLKNNRPVAIKVLKPELAASLGADRFLAEIEITANLQHPHILPLHDSGQADGWLYYVMPYVEGESLQDRLDRSGPLEVGEAVKIAREVADALAYAHEQEVIHRDIKPANLLLVSGHATVADFGIAKAITDAGGEGRTQAGAIMGSPAYMSPEQANGEELDGRSDQYALACVLYEMLAGEPPFTGKGLALLSSHVHEEVPSVRAKREGVPEELDAVIQRALAKSPEDRYATDQAFDEALRTALRGEALRRHATLPATLVTYAAAGWLLSQVIAAAARAFLLPDWVRAGTVGLLLAGLPIVLVTGFLHRSARDRSTRAHRLFSWRNALGGGALAFGALGLGAGGYLASRTLGVGPAATLVDQGALDARAPLILADFGGTDSILARTVTEALRIDLDGSSEVVLVSPRDVREALERMQVDPHRLLEPAVASELAIREGLKGVITGQANAAGSGFMLTVQLVTPEKTTSLISDRETADGPGDVIQAIDNLSRRLRSRIGEPLASIRSSPGLARATTPSLDALKAYTAGYRIENVGDSRTALARYEEALALDSTFAFAWRKVANVLANQGEQRGRTHAAITRAFELRTPLPEPERLWIEMQYHRLVTGRSDLMVDAEQRLAEIRGGVYGQNLGTALRGVGDHARAEEALWAAIPNWSPNSHGALAMVYVDLGRFEDAVDILDRLEEIDPGNASQPRYRGGVAAARGEWDLAAGHYRELTLRDHEGDRVGGYRNLGNLAAIQGRMTEAERTLEEVLAIQESRGLGGDYLRELVRLVELDVWVTGDRVRALERLRAALVKYPLDSLDPHDRPYEALARAFAAAGDPRETRRLLASFEVEIQPMHLEWEEDRAWAHARAAYTEGDAAEVLSELDRRESFRPGGLPDMQVFPLRGRAYELAGQPDSAVALYERYVTTTHWRRHEWDAVYLGWVTERLGQLYDAAGDFDMAATHYARFVELWVDADAQLRPRVQAAQRRLQEILDEVG